MAEALLTGIENRQAYCVLKRIFDIGFSTLALVGTSPLIAVSALAVKCEDPHAPVFFAQERVGLHGKPFVIHKIRTMVVGAENQLEEYLPFNEKDRPVFKMKNDPRITRVGRLLRKSSIDELPQFWDVIRGDMSVVGPRPALPREVESYTAYQAQRLLVKPGVTCFWQALPERDDLSFDEWVELDLRYVRECSPIVDLLLILRTIGCVLHMNGN